MSSARPMSAKAIASQRDAFIERFLQSAAGTGTVMRTDTLKKYATEAGFTQEKVLPIENFFFRFYRLTP